MKFIFLIFAFLACALSQKHSVHSPFGEKPTKKKLSKPTIHPFENEEEFLKMASRDPAGLNTKGYTHGINEMKSIYESGADSNDNFGLESIESTQVLENEDEKLEMTFSGKQFSGTVDLDAYADEAQVVCPNENGKKDSFTLTTSNAELVEALIPGARVHVGFDAFEAGCPFFNLDRYTMITERKSFAVEGGVYTVKFAVKTLGLNEMFESLDLSVKTTKKEVDAARRKEVDIRKSLMFFGFNYDNTKHSVVDPAISLYKDSVNKVTCNNCYAYLDSGIILYLRTSWLSIQEFQIGVYGDLKGEFELELKSEYSFQKTLSKVLYKHKFSAIKFTIGSIPIYITPEIELDAKVNVALHAKFGAKTSLSFSKYSEASLVYDGKKISTELVNNPISFNFKKPYVTDALKGTAAVDLHVDPIVRLYLYAVAPVDFSVKPVLYLDGEVTSHKMSYTSAYQVDATLNLLPLTIPSEIPYIGGKSYDFGGLLPWTKNWVFIPKTQLTCAVCKGEITW